jgi:hypothetical protein
LPFPEFVQPYTSREVYFLDEPVLSHAESQSGTNPETSEAVGSQSDLETTLSHVTTITESDDAAPNLKADRGKRNLGKGLQSELVPLSVKIVSFLSSF